MRTPPTVSRAWVQAILDAAQRAGHAPAQLAAHAGLPASVWNGPRCPLPACIAAWDAAAALTADPLFGLHAGAGFRPLHFNLLGHALAAGETLGDVLARAQRFLPLVSDGGTLETEIAGGQLHVRYIPLTHGWRYSHHQTDAALVAIFRLLEWLLGEDVRLTRVRLSHRPADRAAYRAVFGCPVAGGEGRDTLVLPATLLARRRGNNRVEAARERARAERLLASLRESSWSARTSHLLAAALADGDVTREAVAARLHTSVRSLQRRLRDEGHAFATLLAHLRQDLACEHLDNGITPAETARLLGYSEPAAFHRAFVKWTGITPGQYATRAR